MKRTLTFQLSNLKTTYFYSALFTYGFMALGLLIAFLVSSSVNQSVDSLMFNQPVWLFLISFISAPFTMVLMLYALFDGLMFFDTSLRFGVSRKQYFISQVPVYIILSLLNAFATALTEVEWAGSTSNYFSTISQNYLTLGYIGSQFMGSILLALLALAVYRFKFKAFITGIILFGIFTMVGSFSLFSFMGNPEILETIGEVLQLIVDYQEVFAALVAAGMLGIYYLFVTKTEVQD